jgi:hypothetical protein
MTCWGLRDRQEAEIWQLIHFSLLDWLARQGGIDSVTGHRGRQFDPGSFGGCQTGPNPTDRAKRNSSQQALHSLTPSQACKESEDAHGIVLTAYWATVV